MKTVGRVTDENERPHPTRLLFAAAHIARRSCAYPHFRCSQATSFRRQQLRDPAGDLSPCSRAEDSKCLLDRRSRCSFNAGSIFARQRCATHGARLPKPARRDSSRVWVGLRGLTASTFRSRCERAPNSNCRTGCQRFCTINTSPSHSSPRSSVSVSNSHCRQALRRNSPTESCAEVARVTLGYRPFACRRIRR